MLNHENDRPLEQSVLETMLYFNIFNYPLRADEIFFFLPRNGVNLTDVKNSLLKLVEKEIVVRNGFLYSVQKKRDIFLRRIQGNAEAKRVLPIAERQAKFIGRFPFVRSVMISGSLSKNYMDKSSDLDFFIITAPNRLWICRTLLVLYKRLFLHNSHRLFCVNYFIDSNHLEIEERNLFTATELATIMPFYGDQYYRQLIRMNQSWLTGQFPNFHSKNPDKEDRRNERFKNFTEKALNILGASLWDRLLLKLTQRRWKSLYETDYPHDQFEIAFKSKRYASKNHPRNFQQKVMVLYKQQLDEYHEHLNPAVHE